MVAASLCRTSGGRLVAAARGLGRPAARSLVTADTPKKVKRFYEGASWRQSGGNTWQVLLDGKPVRSPKGSMLELPSQILAEAVAAEWEAQTDLVRPLDMPLMTLGCTAVDLVRPELADGSCVDRLMPYLQTDTLCFEDDNEELVAHQLSEWGPQRRWFEGHFGITLTVGRGLMVPTHPEGTMETVADALKTRSEWELTALEVATGTAKSLVIAVSLMEQPGVGAEDALRWALLEEQFQIERWGLVEGEHDVHHAEALKWLRAAQRLALGSRGQTLEE